MAAIALKRGDSFSSNSGSSNFGGGGGRGIPLSGVSSSPGAGLYGSTLASLGYQNQDPPQRRHSLARNESTSTLGDDQSLLAECDVSSIRSDRNRPGRRASLSAAIELTKSPPPKKSTPKRTTSGGRLRRNSLFGNHHHSSTKEQPEEPEPTPQFFHSRKKEKKTFGVPRRSKSSSYDRPDSKSAQITSQARPGGKIKRPGKFSGRRASMGAFPGRLGLTKSGSKSSVNSAGSGKHPQIKDNISSSGSASSSYDLSDDDDDNYGSGTALRRNTTAPAKHHSKKDHKKQTHDDDHLGYGDPTEYDPQLPPPPPAGANKQKVFVNRRGSTGTAISSFSSNSAAQRSLKESLQWNKQASAYGSTLHMHVSKNKDQRRVSATSSVAISEATDVVNNTEASRQQNKRAPLDIPPPPPRGTNVGSPQEQRRGPVNVLPKRGPADVPPKRLPADVPPGRRVPADVPPSPRPYVGDSEDSSNSSDYGTPLQSNRKIRGHDGKNSSALGSLMTDESDSSHDGVGGISPMVSQRRASRGLSVLQTSGQQQLKPSSMLGGSSLGGGFNPYGTNNSRDSDDEEDDDDEDEEETEEDRAQNKLMATFGSEAGDFAKTDATAPTLITATEASSMNIDDEDDNNKEDNKDGEKDDDSVDSMTSEAPQEKAPAVVDVDDFAESQKKTKAIADEMEEIGATGDWSQGVEELQLKQTANSLLDRYPGSDYGGGAGMGDLGYGGPDLRNVYDEEGEHKDDYDFDNGYGLSDLYDEDYSSFGWRENRPRAADSIEFINMEQLMSKAKNTQGLYLPTFIPAHGCTNASDFIVRCFVARLRAGMTVTKHSRSRFCKSHDRILHILPTGYHVTWIPETEEEVLEKSKKKPPTKLDLTKCLEVRHAWSRDPKSMRYTGTSTLRSKCKEGAASRSFALIYPHRTVDFTAMTVDQCKILMEGFSALCFRLQMARLEQQSGDEEEETQRSFLSSFSAIERDDDTTTASLTGTNMSSAPWGL